MIAISSFEKMSVIHNGMEIEVMVIDIPVPCKKSNKALKAYFKFKYKNKIYSKNIKGKYCQTLKKNKIIRLKTNSNGSTFVYPDENLLIQYISIVILFFVGVLFLLKKNKEYE